MVQSEVLDDFLDEYGVDLVMLHWLNYDLGNLISSTTRRRIPFAVVNHFDNTRLDLSRSRKWVRKAVALGGVSIRGVPIDMRGTFVNLSDAVDTEFFCITKAAPICRPPGSVVLLPGRIVPGKGHGDLLLCMRTLLESGVSVSVAFAGAVDSRAYHDELQKQVSSRGLSNHVVFLGELPLEGLRDWYAASDLVVLPSSSEGLGRVLLEAQAMERPVIAYDCGGTAEAVIPEETGFLVNLGDVASLARQIEYLLKNPARRRRMGESGREFVRRHFSFEALVDRHERFCLKSLESVPRRRLGWVPAATSRARSLRAHPGFWE
ncbi:MAG: glycosyltransferase [Limisphaerales bacterium]